MNLSNRDLGRIAKHTPKKAPSGVAATVKSSQKWEASKALRDLVWDCYCDWEALRPMREEHKRNQRYKNGEHWEDLITDPDNPTRKIREKEYISRQGRTPIQHNKVQEVDRNILGQMTSNPTQPLVISRSKDDVSYSEMLTNTVQAGLDLNNYNILKDTALSYLASAGMCVAKVHYGKWSEKNKSDVIVDIVPFNRFFFNQDAEDPRFKDVYRIGQIHDYSWRELVRDFFSGRNSDIKALREEYSKIAEHVRQQETNTAEENLANLDFYGNVNNGKYRVYEVWTKQLRIVEYVHDKARGKEIFDEVHGPAYYDAINTERRNQLTIAGFDEETIESQLIEHSTIAEEYWFSQWITPRGTCIRQAETPYKHQSHPYCIGSMPRIDGVIKPFYSHLVDINRTLNRHFTMFDFALGSAAKGCLMVPASMLKHNTLEEILAQYNKTNGAIVFDDSTPLSQKPIQLSSSPIPAGSMEFIQAELQQLREVSGLSGALAGQAPRASMPSSLYAQQAQNSMLNFVSMFARLADFNKKVGEKVLQTQMQYYTTKRHIDISGKAYSETARYYDPNVVDKIEDWNLVFTEGTDTPVFRQMQDELLKYLFDAGAINVELLLENTSSPMAQKLLAQVRSAKEQMQNGQMAQAAQGMQDMDLSQLGTDPASLEAVQRLYNENIATVPIQQPKVHTPQMPN